MWFVIGLPGGSPGIQASDDGSEDRSSAVILDSALKRLFLGPAIYEKIRNVLNSIPFQFVHICFNFFMTEPTVLTRDSAFNLVADLPF